MKSIASKYILKKTVEVRNLSEKPLLLYLTIPTLASNFFYSSTFGHILSKNEVTTSTFFIQKIGQFLMVCTGNFKAL